MDMETKKTKNLIIGYGRKSKEDKGRNNISISTQEELCKKYADDRGCKFIYFSDVNKTGDNLNRPEFQKMLEYVKKHRDRIYCIVTYRIDRPTRNIQDYYSIILPFLQRNNVTIACINEGFEDILKLEPMILAVYLGMAAQELKNIKTRAKSTVEYRAKNGYTLGKQPVGYLKKNTKDGTIRIDNDKKHYIKQAFELYATGIFSLEGVGRELAKYGFVNKLGKPYPKKRIEDILKNPVYMGKVPHDGELYQGKHKPIISEELFYRVQARFSDTGNRRPKGDTKTYTGFIKCAKCGCAYTGLVKHGAHNSGTYTYYRCSNYYRVHEKEHNISEHLIDEAMQEVLESFDIPNEQLKRVKKSIFETITGIQAYEHKSIKELQQQYDKLTDVISSAMKQKLSGDLNDDEIETFNELLKKWQKEKREIGNQITNLSETSKETITRMSILTDFANRIPELYLKASLEEKRMILATITESIEIDDDRQIVKVKLKPVFEYLRQLKLQDKKAFSASVEKLNGTLGGRSEKAKQALENNRPSPCDIKDYGTRKKLLNAEIEPNFEGSKKVNVDGGT